jgi:hypothetical protein
LHRFFHLNTPYRLSGSALIMQPRYSTARKESTQN